MAHEGIDKIDTELALAGFKLDNVDHKRELREACQGSLKLLSQVNMAGMDDVKSRLSTMIGKM